jgi:hypothetical protein
LTFWARGIPSRICSVSDVNADRSGGADDDLLAAIFGLRLAVLKYLNLRENLARMAGHQGVASSA